METAPDVTSAVWIDPDTGKAWPMPKGRRWKDGIPPAVRKARAERERRGAVWIDPETGKAWPKLRLGEAWKDGIPPGARKERRLREVAAQISFDNRSPLAGFCPFRLCLPQGLRRLFVNMHRAAATSSR